MSNIIVNKIIKKPRVTEKASFAAEANIYTFDIPKNSNKKEIKKAIFEIYKVKPLKVNVLSVPAKQIFSRGKAGVKKGGKKALVFLKKGDKIEFI